MMSVKQTLAYFEQGRAEYHIFRDCRDYRLYLTIVQHLKAPLASLEVTVEIPERVFVGVADEIKKEKGETDGRS